MDFHVKTFTWLNSRRRSDALHYCPIAASNVEVHSLYWVEGTLYYKMRVPPVNNIVPNSFLQRVKPVDADMKQIASTHPSVNDTGIDFSMNFVVKNKMSPATSSVQMDAYIWSTSWRDQIQPVFLLFPSEKTVTTVVRRSLMSFWTVGMSRGFMFRLGNYLKRTPHSSLLQIYFISHKSNLF